MDNNKDTCIIISSFDGFSDCWDVIFWSYNTYWQNNPYPVYLITNHIAYQSPNLKTIKVGDDCGWASNIKKAVQQLDYTYFIYLQEDFWLNKPINNQLINSHLTYIAANNIKYLRLSEPKATVPLGPLYGYNSDNYKYRICLQAAIWNKDFLLTLLEEKATAWDFENTIRKKIKGLDKIIALNDPITYGISYVNGTAIRKGRWTRHALKYIKTNKLDIDLSKRKTEGKFASFLNSIGGIFRPFAVLLIRIMNSLHINI